MLIGLRKIYNLFVSAGLDAFKDREVPDWLANHPVFDEKSQVKKVFPFIGLPNFEDEVTFSSDLINERKEAISEMLREISNIIDDFDFDINKIYSKLREKSIFDKDYDRIYIKDVSTLEQLFRDASYAVTYADVAEGVGKLKITLKENVVVDGRTILRIGESVFRVFNKLNEIIIKYKVKYPQLNNVIPQEFPNIDTLGSVKYLNKINLPNKKYYVVFSGSGDKGAWDVATMSMRGIRSCQSWDNGTYGTCVIGSVLSRYVGIIYLTSGSDYKNMGSKMLKRAIVRFGINRKTDEKVIIIDKMYPEYDEEIAKMFVKALEKRTSLKILDYGKYNFGDTGLPRVTDIQIPGEEEIENLDESEKPYIGDTGFDTRPSGKAKIEQNIEDKEDILDRLKSVKNEVYEYSKRPDIRLFGAQQDIYKRTLTILNKQCGEIIDNLSNFNLNYESSKKYLMLKINKIFNRYYDLDVESMLKLLYPYLANDTNIDIRNWLSANDLTTADVRDDFEMAVSTYKQYLTIKL